jgi:type I restriction-modification system DNA methylase subunit
MNTSNVKLSFQTPPEIARYMSSLIPAGVVTVLEPTPGIGNIVSCLDLYDVTAPDDFFLLNKRKFDCVIMNPPFSSKSTILDNAPDDVKHTGMKMGYWFLKQCMQLSNNVIALMPWFTISDSDVRLRALKRYGLKSVTALPRKTFEYVRIQTVVLQLEKGYRGDTTFIVYDLLNDNSLQLQFDEYEEF